MSADSEGGTDIGGLTTIFGSHISAAGDFFWDSATKYAVFAPFSTQ